MISKATASRKLGFLKKPNGSGFDRYAAVFASYFEMLTGYEIYGISIFAYEF